MARPPRKADSTAESLRAAAGPPYTTSEDRRSRPAPEKRGQGARRARVRARREPARLPQPREARSAEGAAAPRNCKRKRSVPLRPNRGIAGGDYNAHAIEDRAAPTRGSVAPARHRARNLRRRLSRPDLQPPDGLPRRRSPARPLRRAVPREEDRLLRDPSLPGVDRGSEPRSPRRVLPVAAPVRHAGGSGVAPSRR